MLVVAVSPEPAQRQQSEQSPLLRAVTLRVTFTHDGYLELGVLTIRG